MKSYLCLAVVVPASLTLPALGDITLVSRVSNVAESEYDGGPFGHSDQDTFTGFGAWDVTLERGHRHRSTVDASGISGILGGSGSSHPVFGFTSNTNSLTVRFDVTGSVTTADLMFTGSLSPADGRNNIRLIVQNIDTGATLFDIHRDGTRTVAPDFMSSYWSQQTVSFALPAGRYQFIANASGTDQEHRGPGQGSQGGGGINFTTTFVPAPAATALLGLSVAFTRRRR